MLPATDVASLSADEALDAAVHWERVIAHAQAQQLRVLARFAALRAGGELEDYTADEVAPVLHLSRVGAGARLGLLHLGFPPHPGPPTVLGGGAGSPRRRHVSSDCARTRPGTGRAVRSRRRSS